jgi:hypothetical protein
VLAAKIRNTTAKCISVILVAEPNSATVGWLRCKRKSTSA